jgi:nucleoside-diphosphate-sugar epimerase
LPPTIPTPEEVPLVIPDPHNPRYSYAAGKMISEIMALNYGQKFFDRVVIFRPHNVYGADMGWEHVIPQFILRVHHHPNDPIPFEIQGSGKETRAFVYIDDFTAGLARVINQGEHLGIYHIGTQDEVAIAEVAHMVAAVLERQIVLVPSTAPAGGTPRRCPDISRLVGLGYSPQITLTEGIQRTAAWYIANAQLAPKL